MLDHDGDFQDPGAQETRTATAAVRDFFARFGRGPVNPNTKQSESLLRCVVCGSTRGVAWCGRFMEIAPGVTRVKHSYRCVEHQGYAFPDDEPRPAA